MVGLTEYSICSVSYVEFNPILLSARIYWDTEYEYTYIGYSEKEDYDRLVKRIELAYFELTLDEPGQYYE